MRILIADRLSETAEETLQRAGCAVVVDPALEGDALQEALGRLNPNVLIVRSTRVTRAHIAHAQALSLIVRAGAGVNTIDRVAAAQRGVYVSNCPGTNAIAVAELTLGHILNADRRISDNVADLRAGLWRKKRYAKARGLHGRTLGVIGCGAIGQEVIRPTQAFGMKTVAWSRSLDPDTAQQWGVTWAKNAVAVARVSDILTVHLALTPDTRGLIDAAVFDALEPGALFINTSRSAVVDAEALAQAVKTRGLRAGLDVFSDEPSADGPCTVALASCAEVYGTHHIGASTEQAQEAVADKACQIVLAYKETGTPPNCVNLALRPPATHMLAIRHQDRVGVLAGILALLREADINIAAMENVIFSGTDQGTGGAACARIQVARLPPETILTSIRALEPVFDVQVIPLED